MTDPSRRVRAAAASLFLLVGLGLPAAVAAHAELETVSPADGVTVTVAPTEIVMSFSEALDPAKSSIVLAEVGGDQVLSGGVVDTAEATRMTLAIPELGGGTLRSSLDVRLGGGRRHQTGHDDLHVRARSPVADR